MNIYMKSDKAIIIEDSVASQNPAQSLLSELKRIFRLSSIYAAGDILTMGIGLLLLPVYTAYLMPDDYGILAIATVVTTIAGIMLTFGLNGSALKFYYDLKDSEQKRFYGSLWIFLITIPGAILILIELSGGWLFNALFAQVQYSPYMRLALWTAYITVAFSTLPKELFRASERAVAYTGLSVAQFALVAAFTIWLVAALRQGAEGALWAHLIAVIGIGIIGTVVLRKSVRFALDLRLLKRALLYSLPLLPHFLSHWVLSASDRIILEWYVPLSEVGVYTVGYQIGSAMLLFAVAGNNSIIPLFGRLDVTNDRDVEKLMRIVTYYVLGLTIIGLGIALFSPEIISLLTPAAYHQAAIVVPWVVLGYLFMGLYIPPMNTITLIVGDTKRVGICTMGAAFLNIGLNITLIPRFGMIAAAITTAVSYLVLFAALFLFARQKQPLPYEFRRISITLLAGLATFLIGWNLAPQASWNGLFVKGASLVIFPTILWLSGFFNQQERGAALEVYARIRESVKFLR